MAHEYQHLLHNDLDPQEKTWVNEGCSMYAEVLCGYGDIWPYLQRYLYTPDNGLVDWGDQGDINILADYGGALMFMLYMNDHFGGADIISAIAQNTEHGPDSIDAVLANTTNYTDWTFDDVFYNYRLANLIHSDSPGDGWYNYESVDWGDPDSIEVTTNFYDSWYDGIVTTSSWFGETWTYDVDNTGYRNVGSYGTDYIRVDWLSDWHNYGETQNLKLMFDGWDEVPEGWTIVNVDGNDVWYSTAGNLADYALQGSVDLTGMELAELTFDTYYEIETYWDFGFVQVSTDGGDTWTSLENEYTTNETNPNAIQTVVDNVPGITGYADSWMEMSFNLTEYVGQNIMFQFRYVTDWAYMEMGWMVDNVTVNGDLIDDASSTIGLAPDYPNTDWMVTVYCPATPYAPALVFDVPLDHTIETSMQSIASMVNAYGINPSYDHVYMLVSPTKGMADYSFGVINTGYWIV